MDFINRTNSSSKLYFFTAIPPPDECAKDPCHEFADCTNVGSSYTCACKDGYMGDGVFCMGMIVIGFHNI